MILGKTYFNGTENEKLYLGNTLIYSSAVPATDFIMSVKTDNTGTSNNNQFTIPTVAGNLYNVTTSDGQILNGNTDDLTITFPSAGTYDINISGDFKQILFNNGGDKDKLLDVKNWGNIVWTSMSNAFRACVNITTFSATDAPNLSSVTSMSGIFWGASSFNQPLNSWDVSSVTDMSNLVRSSLFNQPLNSWDVSSVTDMSFMFTSSSFNQPLNSWDVSNVSNMQYIFYGSSFNQSLNSWNVSSVSNMSNFLAQATLSTTNYDNTLIGWAGQIPLSYNGTLNFGSSVYTLGGAAATARASLVSDVGAVSDGGGV